MVDTPMKRARREVGQEFADRLDPDTKYTINRLAELVEELSGYYNKAKAKEFRKLLVQLRKSVTATRSFTMELDAKLPKRSDFNPQ